MIIYRGRENEIYNKQYIYDYTVCCGDFNIGINTDSDT